MQTEIMMLLKKGVTVLLMLKTAYKVRLYLFMSYVFVITTTGHQVSHTTMVLLYV